MLLVGRAGETAVPYPQTVRVCSVGGKVVVPYDAVSVLVHNP